jgi:hypothetical protein
MEVAGLIVAIAAIIISVVLHLWSRAEQERHRTVEQRDVGELKAEISEIRDASKSASRLASEALDEARKAHVQITNLRKTSSRESTVSKRTERNCATRLA